MLGVDPKWTVIFGKLDQQLKKDKCLVINRISAYWNVLVQFIKTKINEYRDVFHRPNIFSKRLSQITIKAAWCLVFYLILFGLKLGAVSLGMESLADLATFTTILVLSYFFVFQVFRAISTTVGGFAFRVLPKINIEIISFGVLALVSLITFGFMLIFILNIFSIYKFNKDIEIFEYDVVHKQNIIYLFGEIGPGMLHEFKERVKSDQPINTVWIDSIGGSTRDASLISEIISHNGYNTRVDAECSSACVEIFSAGIHREIDIYSNFGCHQSKKPGIRGSQAVSSVREILARDEIVASSINFIKKRKRTTLSIQEVEEQSHTESMLEAKDYQESLSRNCSETLHEHIYRVSVKELMQTGLATHVRVTGRETYLSPSSEDYSVVDASVYYLTEERSIHSDVIRTALKRLPIGGIEHWDVKSEETAYLKRYLELAPLFSRKPPDPLCFSEQEYDAMKMKSTEHHQYLSNCGMKSTLDEGDLEPFAELMSRIKIISGCPLPSEYRYPDDFGLCPQIEIMR